MTNRRSRSEPRQAAFDFGWLGGTVPDPLASPGPPQAPGNGTPSPAFPPLPPEERVQARYRARVTSVRSMARGATSPELDAAARRQARLDAGKLWHELTGRPAESVDEVLTEEMSWP